MAEDGQLARLPARSETTEPTLAELLDPIALEERLREARARRAEALARRSGGEPEPRPPTPQRAVMLPATRVAAPMLDARPAGLSRQAGIYLALIFLAGLGLGGATVALLALRSLPVRIAALPPTPAPAALTPNPATTAAALPAATAPRAPTAAPAAEPANIVPAPSPAPVGLPEPATEATPTADDLAAAPPAALLAEPAATPAAPKPEPEPPAAAALPPQVVIHYPASARSEADEIRQALVAVGNVDVTATPVRMAIGRSNVRYYHGSDRHAAGALSALMGSMLPGSTAPDPRDFTDYATPTAPGKVEIWLAGEPDPARTAAAPVPAETLAEPPTQSQAEAVERILIDRLRQQSR